MSGRIDCSAAGTPLSRGPGYTFGFVDSVAERPRSYTARAGTDIAALSIDRETMLDIFEDHPHLAEACLRHVAHRVLSVFETRAADSQPIPAGWRSATMPGIG
jgi:CRP-like cAMP-binding protein